MIVLSLKKQYSCGRSYR